MRDVYAFLWKKGEALREVSLVPPPPVVARVDGDCIYERVYAYIVCLEIIVWYTQLRSRGVYIALCCFRNV